MTLAITALILAGGRGSRMGEVDKGLQPFRGRPMVAHVIERLRPQVDALLINANRHLNRYATFGFPVVADDIGGFAGPLAGLHAGMRHATTPLLVTAPCDSPFLPHDLVATLLNALHAAGADLAVARTGHQPHPVFCLMHTSLAPHLGAFLDGGQRKIDRWYASLKVAEADFGDEAAFANINTLQELEEWQRETPHREE